MFRVNWLRPAAVPLCTNLLHGLTEEDADFLPQTCSFNLSLHYMVLICLIICSCGIQIKSFSRFLTFNQLSKCSFARKKLIRSATTTTWNFSRQNRWSSAWNEKLLMSEVKEPLPTLNTCCIQFQKTACQSTAVLFAILQLETHQSMPGI